MIVFYNGLPKSRGKKWIFRGQRLAEWRLKTSLERAFKKYGVPLQQGPKFEEGLIREFKRHYHLYSSNVPHSDNILEWLALMQHYGAPTRLLDWTYSFYAAVHFAVDDLEKNEDCAVWAFEVKEATRLAEAILRTKPVGANPPTGASTALQMIHQDRHCNKKATFEQVYGRTDGTAFVQRQNPFRLNPRMLVQQGVFLCPGNISISFEDNVLALAANPKDIPMKKLIIKGTARNGAIRDLRRMNITALQRFLRCECVSDIRATLGAGSVQS